MWKELTAKEIKFVLDTSNRIWNEPIHSNIVHCFALECGTPLRLFYEPKTNPRADRFTMIGICPNCDRIHGLGNWRLPRGIVDPENMKALFNLGS